MTALVWPRLKLTVVTQRFAGIYHVAGHPELSEPPGYVKRDAKGPIAVRLDPTPGFTYQQYCHRGLDIRAAVGSQVVAMAGGKVVERDRNSVRGKFATLNGPWRFFERHQHLESFDVASGDVVSQKGRVGKSGATGPAGMLAHLHSECWINDHPLFGPGPTFLNIERLTDGAVTGVKGDLIELLDPPPQEEDVPIPSVYIPGHVATIGNTTGDARVRAEPTLAGKLLSEIPKGTTAERTVTCWVKGDATDGSDQWLAWWNGRWEYTHKINVVSVAPPASCTSAQLSAKYGEGYAAAKVNARSAVEAI